jgi:NAD(P)-dependent dehydrogenase (short-subunit alcohol dehydrogenase family)
MTQGRLAGKVAVVTGAAGALGQAVCSTFAAEGATVAGLDIASGDNIIACDLFDVVSCKQAVESVLDAHGKIDILANVAGGFAMGQTVHETDAHTWELMHKLNTGSVVNMAKVVVPHMLRDGGGKIVNVAARAGLKGAATMGAYVASKSAVIRLTETMAEELKEQKINVNCVMPSLIDTPTNREAMPDDDFSRWVTPESIAEVMTFLATDAARDVHGAALPVEGLS